MREKEARPNFVKGLVILSVVASLGSLVLVRRYMDEADRLKDAVYSLQHQLDILEVADCVDKNNKAIRPLSLNECRRINMAQFASYQNGKK